MKYQLKNNKNYLNIILMRRNFNAYLEFQQCIFNELHIQ